LLDILYINENDILKNLIRKFLLNSSLNKENLNEFLKWDAMYTTFIEEKKEFLFLSKLITNLYYVSNDKNKIDSIPIKSNSISFNSMLNIIKKISSNEEEIYFSNLGLLVYEKHVKLQIQKELYQEKFLDYLDLNIINFSFNLIYLSLSFLIKKKK
jgi:hypothetical protein